MAEREHVQFSWSGGEVSPRSIGRRDIARWQSSAGIVRNFIPLSDGAAMNRPGTEYIGYEHQDYLKIVQSTGTITPGGIPTSVSDTNHSLASGDLIVVSGAATSPYNMAGQISEVEVIDANNFYLLNVDSTEWTVAEQFSWMPIEPSRAWRAVSFEFGTSDTYTLYFGNRYMMVSRDGALVLESDTYTVIDHTYGSGFRSRLTTSAATPWFSGDEVYLGDIGTPPNAKDRGLKRYRVHFDNGAGVTSSPSAVTNANPIVVTDAGHPFSGGEHVLTGGLPGMTELDDLEFEIVYIDANNYSLLDKWGDAVDSTDYGVYTGGGNFSKRDQTLFRLDGTGQSASNSDTISTPINRYYVLRTPYTESDLPNMQFERSQDGTTMSITCDGFAPRKLTRTAHDAWTLTETTFIPSIEPPLTVTPSSTGTTHLARVTAVSKGTGEESVAKDKYIGTHAANQLTIASVTGAFEYNLYLSTVNSNDTGFAGITDTTKVTVDTSAAIGSSPDSPAYDQTIRPPSFQNPFFVDGTASTISGTTKAEPIVVTHDAAGDAIVEDQFVRLESVTGMPELDNKVFQAVNVTGTTLELKHSDGTGHVAVGTGGSVIPLTASDYPTALVYHQQRLVLASTPAHLQAIYMTRSRAYDSMGTSFPIRDSDAIALEVAGDGSNAIRFLVSAGSLLAFTAGGIFEIVGNDQGILTPAASYPVPLSADGCGNIRPVKMGTNIVYVTEQGPNVVELLSRSESVTRSSFAQGEPFLSALARHLLDGYTLTESAAARHPDSLIWYTRSDGLLIALTYVSAAEVVAWSHHDTPGDFESVATVPEPPQTGVYFSVKRTHNFQTKRYFERFNDRSFDDIEDAWFVDCGIKYDESFTATTKRDNWSPLRFYVDSTHTFLAGDQLDVTHKVKTTPGIVNGVLHNIRLAVTTAGADYIDVEDLDEVAYDGTAALSGIDTRTLTLHRCTKTVTGADHLAGVEVSILADGNPVANQTVSAAGELTFTEYHSRIILGHAIEADIETLAPDAPGGPFESFMGVKMRPLNAVMSVYRTRGLRVGASSANLQTPAWAYTPTKYGTAPDPLSGTFPIPVSRESGEGKLFIRQSDPLPATLLALRTDLEVSS